MKNLNDNPNVSNYGFEYSFGGENMICCVKMMNGDLQRFGGATRQEAYNRACKYLCD